MPSSFAYADAHRCANTTLLASATALTIAFFDASIAMLTLPPEHETAVPEALLEPDVRAKTSAIIVAIVEIAVSTLVLRDCFVRDVGVFRGERCCAEGRWCERMADREE